MAAKWIPWLYQYGVGGLIFFETTWMTMGVGAFRSKAVLIAGLKSS